MSQGIEGRLDVRKRLKELELDRPSRLVMLIERLLAQERDRGADAIVELTKKYDVVVADEREKVRERCALRIGEMEASYDTWQEAIMFAQMIIRQLDLTKELAASSVDEGKERR